MPDPVPAAGQGDTKPSANDDSLLAAAAPSEGAPAPKPEGTPAAPHKGEPAKPEGKPGEKAPEKSEDKPIEYAEFKLPEGQTVDKAALDAAVPVFKELKLNQEQAQKLVELQAAMVAKQQGEIQKQIQTWRDDVKKNPDWQKDLGLAKAAIQKLADEDTQKLITGTWFGDHPGFLKFLAKVGKLVSEDPMAGGIPGGAPAPKDPASLVFGLK